MKKVALIFGGGGGIGQAVCDLFKNKDFTVYVTSYKSFSESPYVINCDIKNNDDIKSAISFVIKKEKKLDIVINSTAPPLKLKTLDNLPIEEIKEDLETILLGGIQITKAAIPIMKVQKNGIIIHILTELVSKKASPRMSSYISAKYGLLGLVRSLALELEPFKISIYGLSPSFVETKLIKPFPEKLIEIEKIKRKNKKLVQPEEVAEAIFDLVQNPHKHKSGSNIEIE